MQPEHVQKVMVIDDNTSAADVLVKLLRAIGLEATAVYSGAEALRNFDTFAPDTVIVDIGMPDMDGYEVLAALRKHSPYAFYAIALSGYGSPEDKEKSQSAGFDQHCTKPIGLAELREVLGVS